MASTGRPPEELTAAYVRLLTHDVNNPLAAIRLMAETLHEEAHPPELRQDLADILEAADTAAALVEGLSWLARTEAEEPRGTLSLDLAGVLRQVVDRPALRRRVELRLTPGLRVEGEERRLRRAFTDLLVNARRLVDVSRPIPVDARSVAAGIEIRVGHPGVALPADLRDRLFVPYGGIELREQRFPVLASGLADARSGIERHHGTLAFEDVEGGVDLVVRFRRGASARG